VTKSWISKKEKENIRSEDGILRVGVANAQLVMPAVLTWPTPWTHLSHHFVDFDINDIEIFESRTFITWHLIEHT
jgi:hypothetical protein